MANHRQTRHARQRRLQRSRHPPRSGRLVEEPGRNGRRTRQRPQQGARALLDQTESPLPYRKPPPRAAYALPTLFTAGNIFLGYLSIIRTFHGAVAYAVNPAQATLDFEFAAKTIGFSFILDGLDGRIARMTNTTSEFGKELDSLADIISFGMAPAILAYVWGVSFVIPTLGPATAGQLERAGLFIAFLFLVCGAARLARFNIQKNPVPSNPGPPHRKYFVGLPIPAAAGSVASIVYAAGSAPLTSLLLSAAWLALIGLIGFLMVSTWRYWSFKELNPGKPRSPMLLILMCAIIFAIWNWSQPVLLIFSTTYVASGILARAGGFFRRHLRRNPTPA
jgi:CDP-diacylglycerol--serine O-phosphatidyltransferase